MSAKSWNEYQAWVGTKCRTPVECSVMKLTGEAGEVAELVGDEAGPLQMHAGRVSELYAKHLYHGKALDEKKLEGELGDVLWYVADIARRHNLTLADVAQANVDKIEARYPTGFSIERAQQVEAEKELRVCTGCRDGVGCLFEQTCQP